jgi:hypothetical protein
VRRTLFAIGAGRLELSADTLGCLGPDGGTCVTGVGHLLQAQPGPTWQVFHLLMQALPHDLPKQQFAQQLASAAIADINGEQRD